MHHQLINLLRPLKALTARFLRNLPISSEKLGPPKSFYEATRDWLVMYKPNKSKVQASYVEIHPKHRISRQEPGTIDQDVHWQFRLGYISYQHESPPTFVAVVPDGRVYGAQGTVITPDDKVLADVSIEQGSFRRNTKSHSSLVLPANAKDHSAFRQLKLPHTCKINGTVAVLSGFSAHVYYHWMFDVLPRIELLRLNGITINNIDNFVLNDVRYPFQEETLITLGIPRQKILESSKFPHVKADRLIVASRVGLVFNMPKWACNFLRHNFLSETAKGKEKSNKLERIYLNRANANYRRVVNETELINYLDGLGFESVTLESMLVAEQALLFSSAKVIVAPHGSGLTNLVFCSPGAKVIELFSPNFVNSIYWALSNLIDVEYYYIIGEGKRPPEYVDPISVHDNILIDLDKLAKVIELAGVN